MKYLEERKNIIESGIAMLKMGLTKGTGGNISVYLRDENVMLITPSGIEYEKILPEDIVVMNLSGEVLEGERRPSSEYRMHSIVYENRYDINAIVHTHSNACAAVACMRKDLPAVHYMVAVGGGTFVKCAEYATFGTEELAKNALCALEDRKAVLLANHGLLACAGDVKNALNIADELEFVADLYLKTYASGEAVILDDEEMTKMLGLFGSYGQIKSDDK